MGERLKSLRRRLLWGLPQLNRRQIVLMCVRYVISNGAAFCSNIYIATHLQSGGTVYPLAMAGAYLFSSSFVFFCHRYFSFKEERNQKIWQEQYKETLWIGVKNYGFVVVVVGMVRTYSVTRFPIALFIGKSCMAAWNLRWYLNTFLKRLNGKLLPCSKASG